MPLPRPNAIAVVVLLASLAQAAAPAGAAKETPKQPIVGDDAPPLVVGRWFKGEPVENLDRGRVYVIDFWASSLGTCKASIPHLTTLATKYPAVTFIGVAIDVNVPEAVAERLNELGDKAGYRFTVDTFARPEWGENFSGMGEMLSTWLNGPYNRNTFPVTYVVDADGTIAWVGSPMRVEETLKQILAGTLDRAKARDAAIANAAIKERRAAAELEYANALQNTHQLNRRLRRNIPGGDNAIADADPDDLALQERIYAKYPEAKGLYLWAKFRRLMKANQYDEAYKVADERAAADDADDAQVMNELAWCIVDDPSITTRDLPRARRYAEKAAANSDHVNAAILDTLAKACFLQGEVDRAIELQARAVELANVGEEDMLRGTLDGYRDAKQPKPATK